MQADMMRGFDFNMAQLWEARAQPTEGSVTTVWIASGAKECGILVFMGIKAVLTHYLTAYPETDNIQAVLGGNYRIAMPANAAATTIIDAILAELQVDE